MGPVALLIAAAALCVVAPATANAASLTIAPPASAPSEDSGFPIVVSGNTKFFADNDGYLTAKIRPAGSSCAPTPGDDSGDTVNGINDGPFRYKVAGEFSVTGSKVLSTAGNYVICAWLEDDDTVRYGPVGATVTVRPPQLSITMSAPASVTVGVPFQVTVNYSAEVPRYLSVIVARASSCSISSSSLKDISSTYSKVADEQRVSGSATIEGAASFDSPGTYLVCGFFEKTSSGAAQYAVQGPSVIVAAKPTVLSCGKVGGRRQISKVKAKNVSCTSAKRLARRWGRKPRRRIGSFTCAATFPSVKCSTGSKRVTFRYRGRT